jgi:pyruvate/2-oxoglutarate dehydrogenase complex dihydrolipoamide dehydrogenase (E3) component
VVAVTKDGGKGASAPKPVLKPDLCVIGGGSAGLSVAAIAASFGVPVVLVEKGRMGGECLHTGCVPSKALLAAGHVAETFRRASPFGIASAKPRIDPKRVREHIRDVIAGIAPNDSAERFGAMGVQVLRGHARFLGPGEMEVGGTRIRARRFVLATGSRPAIPTIPGLAETPFLTNETIFDLAATPGRLVVIGAGPVGIEIAQAWRRLGAEVTVLASGPALARIDPEIAAPVLTALRREGVVIHERAAPSRVENWAGGIRVEGPGYRLDATHVLVAAGRKAMTEDLGLEAAGIAADPSGILVDAGLRTANRRVYAIGDCAGGPHGGDRFTHAANYHAGLVIRSALFRVSAKVDRNAIPRTVFTDPEIAVVGLREDEARLRHKDIRVLRWPFAENDRARAERATAGEAKIVTTRKGRVLGAAIVGARASDLIVPWTLAVRKQLDVSEFRDLVVPYPTYSEVGKRAAVSFYAEETRRPGLSRVLRLLRIFG